MMTKIIDIKACLALWEKFSRQHNTRLGLLDIEIAPQMKEQEFSLIMKNGRLSLISNSKVGFYQGLFCAKRAVLSKQLGDAIGHHKPAMALRVLSLEGNTLVTINEDTYLKVPQFLSNLGEDKEKMSFYFEQLALRLLEMGYNSLFLGQLLTQEEGSQQSSFFIELLYEKCKEMGISLILSAKIEEGSYEEVFSKVPCDYIFWEAQDYFSLPKNSEEIFFDCFMEKITLLEKACQNLGKKTLVAIPWFSESGPLEFSQQWLEEVSDQLGKDTILCFSSMKGTPSQGFKGFNSLWNSLGSSLDISATRLMPVISLGGSEIGEGLWGISFYEKWHTIVSKIRRHNFAGVMVETSRIPKAGALLDGILTCAGLSQWDLESSRQHLETWLQTYRSNEDLPSVLSFFKEAEDIFCDLKEFEEKLNQGNLDRQQQLVLAQSILGNLRKFQDFPVEEANNPYFESTSTYQRLFLIDLKRMFYRLLQENKLSLPSVLEGKDLEPTFWTSLSNLSGNQISSGAKVQLHESPIFSSENKILEKVFVENTFGI
jgi:hypothetical protein